MLGQKNRFFLNKNNFIRLAYEQAKINLGSTGPNPSVGCVVEKDGSIISSACTSIFGRPHAEFNALNKKINFKNSNIYLSLEPCSHYGQTPPCTNIIIKKKIRNVYFSLFDVDKRSRGKSLKKLKEKNIQVQKGLVKEYGKYFYESYYLNKIKNFPFIDAKIAISGDYFTKSKSSKWITNSKSRKVAHLLRSKYDSILSTSKSINEDNSELSCRIEGLEEKSPNIVILDRNLKIKKNLRIFNKKKRKLYLITQTTNKSKEIFLKKKGVKIIRFKSISTIEDYKIIFFKLRKLGISRILVESGVKLLSFLLKSKMINNLYIFKSNKKLKNNGINSSKSYFVKKMKFNNRRLNVYLNEDKIFKIRLKNV